MKTKIDALAGRKPLFAFDLDSTVTRCELLPLLARLGVRCCSPAKRWRAEGAWRRWELPL